MRITTDPAEGEFKPLPESFRISLNDSPVELCVEADEERGMVKTYLRTANRNIKTNNGTPIVRTLYGKVRIKEIQ